MLKKYLAFTELRVFWDEINPIAAIRHATNALEEEI